MAQNLFFSVAFTGFFCFPKTIAKSVYKWEMIEHFFWPHQQRFTSSGTFRIKETGVLQNNWEKRSKWWILLYLFEFASRDGVAGAVAQIWRFVPHPLLTNIPLIYTDTYLYTAKTNIWDRYLKSPRMFFFFYIYLITNVIKMLFCPSQW